MMSNTPHTFVSSTTFRVTGMTCEHCRRAVQQEIGQVPGVQRVDVDLATYYIGLQMAGRAVLLQVEAHNRQFAVWHQDQIVKRLPIKGLVGQEMALDEYVQYIQQEALAALRRASVRGSRKIRQPSLWEQGA